MNICYGLPLACPHCGCKIWPIRTTFMPELPPFLVTVSKRGFPRSRPATKCQNKATVATKVAAWGALVVSLAFLATVLIFVEDQNKKKPASRPVPQRHCPPFA